MIDEIKRMTVTIRMEEGLVEQLKEMAERETRSFSGQVEHMLKEAVRRLAAETHKKPHK